MDFGFTIGEDDVLRILDNLVTVLFMENNVAVVDPPVTIVGDVHGQYEDVRLLLQKAVGEGQSIASPRDLHGNKFLFMGDYVDRGYYSLNTLLLIATYKLQKPGTVTMIRGNHESRQVTQQYGFYQEIMLKYGHGGLWLKCMQVFDAMPMAALTGTDVFSVHGGISPSVVLIELINRLNRKVEIPQDGVMADLSWSDPEDGLIATFRPNPRGAGYIFGQKAVEQFLRINRLKLITRSHQLVQTGFQYYFANDKSRRTPQGRLLNVWSAPNYSYTSHNTAAFLRFGADRDNLYDIVTFKEAPAEFRIDNRDLPFDSRYFA
jgi:diadenosine tetraphosphatase ApaH/serine/threonine PP2A family protein phosphatase